MVVLVGEVEHPPGVAHGAGHVAQHQGLPGTGHRDRPREAAVFLLVHHDRPVRRRVQPPLGVPQPGLDARELAAHQERMGIPGAEHGPAADQLGGERGEPAQ